MWYNNRRTVIIPPDFNASFARRPQTAGNRKSYAHYTIHASRSWYNNRRTVIIPPDFNASFARRPQTAGNRKSYAHYTIHASRSWYNNRRKSCCASLYGCRLPVLRTDVVLTASQKCPCEQAFLLRGIIKSKNRKNNVRRILCIF